jgi:hypothetical protein
MNFFKSVIIKQVLVLFSLLNLSNLVFSQQGDTLKQIEPLKASANFLLTNKGISLFPNLSLGKPAAILSLVVGKKHFFFEPELRWRLNGNPWSYIFWLRYRSSKTEHFSWHIGAHPSYVMRENDVTVNGKDTKRWIAQRNVAAEIVPVWHYSPKFMLALQVLASRGSDTAYGVQKSFYASLQPRFPHIALSKNYYLGFFPQVFHLVLDDKEGTYYSHLVSLNKKDLPFYFTSIFTYKLKSSISGDQIVWNVGLNVKL